MALRALARGQRTDAIDCGVQDLRSAEIASGKPAVVNVITDSKARAQTVRFSAYTT